MAFHTVKPGEHLAQIVRAGGFTDFKRIFDLSENAELKSARKTPHILAPKDKVFVPEFQPKIEPGNSTEQRHTFKARFRNLKLRVKLLDRAGSPLKGQKCLLAVESEGLKLTTDDSGIVAVVIPGATLQGRLAFQNVDHAIDTNDRLLIGGLDPIDTAAGQIGRLNNLGYLAGDPLRLPGSPPASNEEPDPEAGQRFRSAVEEFQVDHSLTVDGTCGPKTQTRLKEAHGC